MNEQQIPSQEKIECDVDTLMQYVAKLKDSGAIDLFSPLFQSDYRILLYISSRPNAHPSNIAKDLNITRPNVAANLRLLESKNYITRIVDKNNRRQVFVNLTSDGADYMKSVVIKCKALFKGWFLILGEDEVEHLFKILELSSRPEIFTDELKKIKL